MGVCVDESCNGLANKAAEDGEQVSDNGGTFGTVNEDLDEIGHGDESDGPSDQQDPENGDTSLDKHCQLQIVPSESIKNCEHQ